MNEEIEEADLNTEEKCVPRKRQRENTGSQTDEDCVYGRCCDASASIIKLVAKIDKPAIRFVYGNSIGERPFNKGRRGKQTAKEGC